MLTKEHKALFNMVRGWGGTVIAVRDRAAVLQLDQSGNDFAMCPFDSTLGINWKTKTLYYAKNKIPSIYTFLHECGHIFASNKEPFSSDEISFFAWEFVLAQTLHVLKEWEHGSQDYTIGHLSDYGIDSDKTGIFDYGELCKYPKYKALFWKERVSSANALGLVVGKKVIPIR